MILREKMEVLIFAFIASYNACRQQEWVVAEPRQFQPVDLQALRNPARTTRQANLRVGGRHYVQSSPKAGRLRLVVVRGMGEWLDMSISDAGQGVPATAVDRVFFAVHPRLHALSLLRRRLQGLFGRSFRLEVGSEVGRGTTIRMRIPLRRRFDIAEESLEARQF
jgi:hypothetical protein